MSQQLENSLRKAMQFLGMVIEKAIGKAKEATVQVGTRKGMQPIMSVEGQLEFPRIKELIELCSQRMIEKNIPMLNDAMVLELGEGPAMYGQRLMSKQAAKAVSVEIGGASIGRQGDVSRGYVVRSSLSSLPFEDEKFGYVLARLATPLQGDMSKGLSEIGRVLKHGGQGMLVDYHPYGLYSKKGSTRLRPATSCIHKIEDYYANLKNCGLRVIDIKEIVVDDSMRKFFKEEEIAAYRSLKGSAFLIYVFFYRPKSK